jgi:hypothetical protein
VGEISDIFLFPQRGQQAAGPFHQDNVAALQPVFNSRVQPPFVELLSFFSRGQVWRKRRGKDLRTHAGEVSRAARGFPQEGGITGNQLVSDSLAAARGRLIDPHFYPASSQLAGDGGRYAGFADAGIGPGDEQAWNGFQMLEWVLHGFLPYRLPWNRARRPRKVARIVSPHLEFPFCLISVK